MGRTDNLSILNLPISPHGIAFPSVRSSVISVISVTVVCGINLAHFFRLISMHFVFDTIIHVVF